MMKLFERDQVRETVKDLPETHEDLPKLPDDVTVPDDISGVTHPTTEDVRRPSTGVRWMRWLAVAALLVTGAVVAAFVLRSDTSDTTVADGYAVAEVESDDHVAGDQRGSGPRRVCGRRGQSDDHVAGDQCGSGPRRVCGRRGRIG